jgi:outer membrane immunogenic protein
MKATVLGIMAGLLFGGSAMSADLTPYKAPPPPPAVPLAYDWSGVYVGGHIGGGWDTTKFSDTDAYSNLIACCIFVGTTNAGTAPSNLNTSSFLGGAQAGWMYQTGRLVVGGDFDWSATHMNGSANGVSFPAFAAGGPFAAGRFNVDTKWTATSTLTVGLARDRWMFYSKTGFAAAENTYKLNIGGLGGFGGAPAFAFSSSTNDTVVGWTFGTGVKWAFADNWFVNAEYDFLDFGSKSENLSGTFSTTPAAFAGSNGTATFTPTFRQYISEVKVGLNYKFSPGFLFW